MKIGLFGGAFNPPHYGHIAIAKAAIYSAGLDRLIIIPSGNAPHKRESAVSRTDRLNMAYMAFDSVDKTEVSDYELKRSEISYSADTAEHFKKLYPNDELYFLIGDDSYNQLSLWHEPQRILKCCTLLVFPREGADVKKPALYIEMEKIAVSSSDVREKFRNNEDVSGLVPENVLNYIRENKLYTD